MSEVWQSWCRLCAKRQTVFKLDEVENLRGLAQKCFNLEISEDTHIPWLICEACHDFLAKFEGFSQQVRIVNQLFHELAVGDFDPEALRDKFLTDETSKPPAAGKKQKPASTKRLTRSTAKVKVNHIKEEESQCLYSFYEANNGVEATELSEKIEEIDVKEFCVVEPQNGNEVQDDDNSDGLSEKEVTIDVKKKYECDHCHRFFSRRHTLEEHMRLKHKGDDKSLPFVCETCSKRFVSEKKLKQHVFVHLPMEQKLLFPCQYCDKKFTRSVTVQAHIKTIHIGCRPFVCETCGKNFQTKGALKDHHITHSDSTPFQCSVCSKSFKNQARLKCHEDTHNNTVYICPHCGLQLNTKRTLKMHLVVHSDEKRFKCSWCNSEFKRSKALKNHLILHTGLRPYACNFCDKTFSNGSNCRSHKKKAHPAELAALEASGKSVPTTNIPRLGELQPRISYIETYQTSIIQQIPIVETTSMAHPMQVQHIQLPAVQVPVTMLSLVPAVKKESS